MYKLVDMTHIARPEKGDADGDDPRQEPNPSIDDSIDNDDIEDGSKIKPTRRCPALHVSPSDLIDIAVRAACGLFIAVAALALLTCLFYFVLIRRPLAAVDRMVASECNITSHSIESTKVSSDGTPKEYIPGLGVRFIVGHGDGNRIHEAVAMPCIHHYESWMLAVERDAYFARFKVGSVARCYYSREEYDFVAMSDESDRLSSSISSTIAVVVVGCVGIFCCCACFVYVEVDKRQRPRAAA
nr:hypothetical protein [Pandoravirus massiliensis]